MKGRAIVIFDEPVDWIDTNNFDLSLFVRKQLDKHIKGVEKEDR